MLGVGIDWAEEFHLVALGRPDQGIIDVIRVDHAPAAVTTLLSRIRRLEPDPAEVRVVIEARHGLLVEALSGLTEVLHVILRRSTLSCLARRSSGSGRGCGRRRRRGR